MLVAKTVSALLNQVQMHLIGQLRQIGQLGLSGFKVAEQGLRQREDRIGQRIDLNPGGLCTQEGLGGLEGRRGCCRCHAAKKTEIDVKSKPC